MTAQQQNNSPEVEISSSGRPSAVTSEGDPAKRVTFSLISHTNVGKTTLARTLLRRDVGDVLDHEHVTDLNQRHSMLEDDGYELVLWDTPGFGHTGRLLKRLEQSGKPLRWFATQLWDRITDRPLWCSQQAVLNVRDEADIVLYLVNAGTGPEDAGYVGPEMKLLSWIGKPVVVILNQTGTFTNPDAEARDEALWRNGLKEYDVVRDVVGLDAFGRCWVQEGELLELVAPLLPAEKQEIYSILRKAWRRDNLAVFDKAVAAMAQLLAGSVMDSVRVTEESLAQKFGIGRGAINDELAKAKEQLAARLAQRTFQETNELISLYGLDGQTAQKMADVAKENFGTPDKVNESVWSLIGGVATGASGGLIADILAGGFTFGGGVIGGAILGGAGAYALARGFNLAKGQKNHVRWSHEHFVEQVRLALLTYLAVAHFGRGRGSWEDSEHPEFWRAEVAKAVDIERPEIEKIWKSGADENARRDRVESSLAQVAKRSTSRVLGAIYPECKL
jgi:hypothetical protein